MEPLLKFLHDISLLHCPFNMTESTIPWPSSRFYLFTVSNGQSFPYQTHFISNPSVTPSFVTLCLLIFLSRLLRRLTLEFMVYGCFYLRYWYWPNAIIFHTVTNNFILEHIMHSAIFHTLLTWCSLTTHQNLQLHIQVQWCKANCITHLDIIFLCILLSRSINCN